MLSEQAGDDAMHKGEHKQQLHERILERRDQLVAARAREPEGRSEHARAVDGALAQLAMHLGTEWIEVDQVEAAQLSGWLESTRFLVGTPHGSAQPTPPAGPAPQTRGDGPSSGVS
jgi:hypothetical protein